MSKFLFAVLAFCTLALAGCGSTDPIFFNSQTVMGLELGATPATGDFRAKAGTGTNNQAVVPQTVETENGRIQLQSTYREWGEDGLPTIEAIDGPSTCAVFNGFANATPGQGNIGVDQGFATGVAAQDLCIAARIAPIEIVGAGS